MSRGLPSQRVEGEGAVAVQAASLREERRAVARAALWEAPRGGVRCTGEPLPVQPPGSGPCSSACATLFCPKSDPY